MHATRELGLLTLLFALACADPVEGQHPGECTDRADNDADGAYDCDDSDCAGSPDCRADTGDTDTDTDTDTDSESGADTDTDTDTDTDSDTGADTDTDTDTGTDTDTDTDTDSDTDPGESPGARWSGESTLPDGTITLSGTREGDLMGLVLSVGDEDLDGHADLLLAGPYAYRSGADDAGSVCLVRGPITADLDMDAAFVCIDGAVSGAYLGASVSIAGDLDGDGIVEIAVSAPTSSMSYTSAPGPGSIYLFSGLSEGSMAVSDAVATWTGEGSTDGAGRGLIGGVDLTGDDLPDVALGASTWGRDDGAAYILGESALEGGSLSGADVRIYPLDPGGNASFGSAVADLGDLDGDGATDLGVGWGGYRSGANSGALAVFLGPVASDRDAADADSMVLGRSGELGWYQTSVISAGDVDGDGANDVLVAAPTATVGSNGYAGTAYFVSGEEAVAGLDVLLASATLNGDAYGQQLGYGMTSLGDQDGDGYGDVAVGARGDSTEAREGGAVFVFYGPLSGDQTPDDADASWFGTSAGAGTRVAGGVELTGDAYTDLLIASCGEDDAGAVNLVAGVAP